MTDLSNLTADEIEALAKERIESKMREHLGCKIRLKPGSYELDEGERRSWIARIRSWGLPVLDVRFDFSKRSIETVPSRFNIESRARGNVLPIARFAFDDELDGTEIVLAEDVIARTEPGTEIMPNLFRLRR